MSSSLESPEMMPQSPGPTPDPELPLLSWENVQHCLPLSPRSRPSLVDNDLALSNVASVLSATSYPLAGRFPSRKPRGDLNDSEVPFYGGLLLENSSPEDDHDDISASREEAALSNQPPRTLSKRQRPDDNTASPPSKKRGRPRKSVGNEDGNGTNERRRLQIREAQRAYQSRREANMSSLKNRISQLEASVERMNAAVLYFNDQFRQSGILAPYPNLGMHLRDTVRICLNETKHVLRNGDKKALQHASMQNDTPQHLSMFSSEQPLSPSSLLTDLNANSASDHRQAEEYKWFSRPLTEDTSEPSSSQETSGLDLSAFIERLHVVCVCQGYLVLTDPSISLDRIRKPFRLMLTMMDRERLASYFEAAVHARISHRPFEHWTEVPFFSLGDAGTHYPEYTTQAASPCYQYQPYRKYTIIKNPLARFSPEVREELSGEWFDMYDLKGYLREKGVHFLTSPPLDTERVFPAVNMSKFVKALINRALCLGRTPGFRRFDVDEAIRSALWT